jgi:hypothetical protein
VVPANQQRTGTAEQAARGISGGISRYHEESEMKRASQITFGLVLLFLAFFLFGITDAGQTVLRGRIPPNTTGFERDDIYMGAAFAP